MTNHAHAPRNRERHLRSVDDVPAEYREAFKRHLEDAKARGMPDLSPEEFMRAHDAGQSAPDAVEPARVMKAPSHDRDPRTPVAPDLGKAHASRDADKRSRAARRAKGRPQSHGLRDQYSE